MSLRTAGLVALTVLCVLLAGCSGSGSGSIPGAEGAASTPTPYTDSGAELDASALADAHAAGLAGVGSYNSSIRLDVRTANRSMRMDRSMAVDAAADAWRSTTRVEGDAGSIERYVLETYANGNTTYVRVEAETSRGSIVRYDSGDSSEMAGMLLASPDNRSEAGGATMIARTVEQVNWTLRGVERHEGDWVTRYEASDPAAFSLSDGAPTVAGTGPSSDGGDVATAGDAEITAAEATLLVDADGVVRRLRVSAEGTADGSAFEVAIDLSIEGLGTTAVDEPGWLEEARSADGGMGSSGSG